MASKLKEYGEVLTFFLFETLAFTSFTLGNNMLLYFLFSFLTLAMIIIFNIDHLKDLDWMYYLIFMIPFILFSALSAFNKFTLFNNIRGVNSFSLGTNCLAFVTLVTFLCVGFLSKTVKNFKITTGMMVIYGGLSIIVLIAISYAMVKYVPFYTLIYRGKFYYYMGERIPIWDNIPFLMGFKFEDVTIEYFQLFATMLFTSVIGLRYINPKKDTRTFILYCIFAVLGFTSIIFTLNKLNIITFVIVSLFIIFLLFVPKKGKVIKPIFYTVLGLGCLGITIFFINAQSEWAFAKGLQDLIANNGFLNRIFNSNRFATPVKEMMDGCLQKSNLLSHTFNIDKDELFQPSGMFIFDAIIFSGTLGGIALVIFIIFVFINLVKYYTKSEDDMLSKNLTVGFIGTFALYSFFALDATPYIHYNAAYLPLQHQPMFFITLFLIGYTFMGRKKEVKVMEEVIEETKENTEETTDEKVTL